MSAPVSSLSPAPPAAGLFRPRLRRRNWVGRIFSALFVLMAFAGTAVLALLLIEVYRVGRPWLSWNLLTRPNAPIPEFAGVQSALWGTVWLIGLTAVFSLPVGVGAAIYLQEYARPNRLTRFIHLNIANLAGVPSIVYGILGLAVFVRWMALGHSVLAGALTLSLLILPVIIIASQEALVAVPHSIRLAAYALGATRWQMVRYHVLPAAMPGILTGVILALSRAIGEAAPLILVGAVTYIASVPDGPLSGFTALPLQIFNWSEKPQEAFRELAAAAIIVLLAILLTMNAVAVGIRTWEQRKRLW